MPASDADPWQVAVKQAFEPLKQRIEAALATLGHEAEQAAAARQHALL